MERRSGGGDGAANGAEVAGVGRLSEERRRRIFRCICGTWFFAVVSHTLNLQSEAILIRNACKGDLGKTARVVSNCNAIAGLSALIVNQVGGKLSDSLGRVPFYLIGPLAQLLAGAVVFSRPSSLGALAFSKVTRATFTTFSGTVMGAAGLRDCFQGQEFGIKVAEAGGIMGLGIMVGPVLETLALRSFGHGRGERLSYLLLVLLGFANLVVSASVPESLPRGKRSRFDLDDALRSANPFGFLRIYTEGSAALKKVATIGLFQSMIDGKTMSDLSQIWMREHLKLSVESIRNFLMGFGLLSSVAGRQIAPAILRRTSVRGYTTFTNLTNLLAFSLRGLEERATLFFGALPLMLPGVNGAASSAIHPVVNAEMVACGFGVGESTAWTNNLRALAGIVATLVYGHFYSWCKQRGIYPGYTFVVAGLLGAGVPQAILSLAVRSSELGDEGADEEEGAAGLRRRG